MSAEPASPSPAAVRQACTTIADAGKTVTFTAVAEQTGISRTTLYRRTDLRQLIEEHREPADGRFSLGRMAAEIDQLRRALEATAASVRRHEEQIRSLNRDRRAS
jgi:DNA-binding IclR family transcriptional regulator